MPEGNVTLAGALGLDDEAAREQLADAVAGDAGVRDAAGQLDEKPSPGLFGAVAGQVAERLRELLDVPLTDVLSGAWSKCLELAKYCDPDQYPPGETIFVTLAPHTVRSSHKPQVELKVNEKPVATLQFVVNLAVELQGARLSLREGRILALHTGKAEVKGSLGLQGIQEPILKRKKEIAFPGTLSFGEGIRIAPAVKAAAE